MQHIIATELFDLSHSIAGDYISSFEAPWQALRELSAFIIAYGKTLSEEEFDCPTENVWIAKSATVSPTAYIGAPCIICADAEIRHCAYIRGSAIVGRGAVVGNSCELKNCILFDGAQTPHYNYVGDSILGYRAHLGAGAVTSNVKSDKSNVCIRVGDAKIPTDMRKLGALVGDLVEVGCGCVLNPGTIIGKKASIYPLTSVRGSIPADHIVKSANEIVARIHHPN